MPLPDIPAPIGAVLSGGASGFLTAIMMFELKLSRMKDRQVELEKTVETKFQQSQKIQVATLEIVANVAKHLNLDRREYSDILVRALTSPENNNS